MKKDMIGHAACEMREKGKRGEDRSPLLALHPLRFSFLWLLSLVFLMNLRGAAEALTTYPVHITDSAGASITLPGRPERVISLSPGITEILFELGAGDAIQGLTFHDTHPPETIRKKIVGGFLSPSLNQIEALHPDVIFLTSLHGKVRERFAGDSCRLIRLENRSLSDLYRNIELLGALFDKGKEAEELIRKIQDQLQLVSRKVEKIPMKERKRVMRFMGRDEVMTPGDDSFQNEFIRAAGSVPPELGKKGSVVPVSLEEWKRFNPQVIYGCKGDLEAAERLLTQPGWKDVEAVRHHRILTFPCELTCRASAHTGYFVAWLASSLYEEAFSTPQNQVLEEKRVGSRSLELPLDYVKSAGVDETTLFDFPNKTLIVEFKEPLRILSTLEGERTGITTVGNHGSPPQCWGIHHRLGLEGSRGRIYKALGQSPENSSFLFTGADMDNLVIRKAEFRDMTVYALVTAGVKGNAVRMSADEGRFYEPGTINILLMTNRQLTPRAMARAVISATEAKTAALQDLDVRSCGNPLRWQATGTGTDEMVVVEGRGKRLDNAGGHCKLGELIARAVYDGVREAVFRQNGLTARRNVFQRLQERGISPSDLLHRCDCLAEGESTDHGSFSERLEEILLEPRYVAFIESALALSDAHESGSVTNPDAFELWCRKIAEDIAGKPIGEWKEWPVGEEMPVVVEMALNAILNGLAHR